MLELRAYAAAVAWMVCVSLAGGVVGALLTGLSSSDAHDVAAPVGGALVGFASGIVGGSVALVGLWRRRRIRTLWLGAALAAAIAILAVGGVAAAVQAELIRW